MNIIYKIPDSVIGPDIVIWLKENIGPECHIIWQKDYSGSIGRGWKFCWTNIGQHSNMWEIIIDDDEKATEFKLRFL